MQISCENGHTFERSSNCRVCPTCFAQAHSDQEFLKKFSAPAQRAMIRAGITSIDQLEAYSLVELSKLHGIGQSTIIKIKDLLDR